MQEDWEEPHASGAGERTEDHGEQRNEVERALPTSAEPAGLRAEHPQLCRGGKERSRVSSCRDRHRAVAGLRSELVCCTMEQRSNMGLRRGAGGLKRMSMMPWIVRQCRSMAAALWPVSSTKFPSNLGALCAFHTAGGVAAACWLHRGHSASVCSGSPEAALWWRCR